MSGRLVERALLTLAGGVMAWVLAQDFIVPVVLGALRPLTAALGGSSP